MAQYLERYAQPEAEVAHHLAGYWSNAIVIPLLGEDADAVARIVAQVPPGVLTIAVVNATADRPAIDHERNRALLAELGGSGDAWWKTTVGNCQLVVIDRCSDDRLLPGGEGVGLARRIGIDLALALWAKNRLRSRFLHTTDADATLPPDYFAAAAAAGSKATMLSYRFWHDAAEDSEVNHHTALYEIWLRYYVVGLRRAGSPFGHHAIGSSLAADAEAYARVRGIPRRQGGEDFYLMNKLRKLGPIETPQCSPIRLQARQSNRAPFGTGPAIARMLAGEPLELYHPECFDLLGEWLAYLAAVAEGGASTLPALERSSAPLRAAADAFGVEAALQAICSTTRTAEARRTRIMDWFDGKQTLLFVHRLRDQLGTSSWQSALARWGADIASPDAARHWLAERDHGTLPE